MSQLKENNYILYIGVVEQVAQGIEAELICSKALRCLSVSYPLCEYCSTYRYNKNYVPNLKKKKKKKKKSIVLIQQSANNPSILQHSQFTHNTTKGK
jgi:hypothetical protein